MSDTAGNVLARIQLLYHDDGQSDPWTSPQLYGLISAEMMAIQNELHLPDQINAALFTLVPGTTDYALPTNEYQSLRGMHLVTYGFPLRQVTWEIMEGLVRAVPAASIPSGIPYLYAAQESSSQVTTLRLYPTPNVADTVSAVLTALPARIATSVDVVPLDREATTALEYRVAATVIDSMADEALERLKLSPATAGVYRASAASCLQAAGLRQNQMRRQGRINRSAA